MNQKERNFALQTAIKMLEIQGTEPKFTIDFISKITGLGMLEIEMLNQIRIEDLKN